MIIINYQGGMKKSQIKQAAKEKPFKEFDPTMSLRKGGKLGILAFILLTVYTHTHTTIYT